MEVVAGIITTLFGLSLFALLIMTLLKKEFTMKFLSSFASSAKAHYIEQLLRIIAGLGLLIYSDHMLFPALFKIFGWGLTASSALLIIMPWKWHNKFGKLAIPFVIRNLVLYTISASIIGLVIIYCVIAPLI